MTSMDNDELIVEMFPAQHGDAFLVRAVANGRPTNILVDAGPMSTYQRALRPRLAELAANGEELRALVVTHIDADHIEGAIEFLEDNGPHSAPNVIGIADVWHNSYRHLQQQGRTPTPAQIARVHAQVTPRVASGNPNISARHGSTLAALLRKHRYPWNAAFGGGAISVEMVDNEIWLDDGVSVTLLSPRQADLVALERMWRRELLALGVARDVVDAAAFEEAFERVVERESHLYDDDADVDTAISGRDTQDPPDPALFREDRSKPNASSISFLLNANGKRLLFLGDAWPSTIVERLRASGLGAVDVAALKLSHHGSKRNTSPELCAIVRPAHCLISTDGSRHGHPDLDALLWLVSRQHGVHLHFNYRTPSASSIASPELVKRFGHSVSINDTGKIVTLVL